MKGWKTWAGGLGMIFSGLGMIGNAVYTGDYSNLTEAITLVTGGLAVIGIGHKIQKASGSA